MAKINGSTNSSSYIIWLNAYEKDYSINNNTSTVVVELYMQRTSGSYAYNGGSYSGSITVNGTSQSYSGSLPYPSAYNEGQSRLYATKTFSNIPHNNDGTKTVSISASYSADFSPTSGSASGNLTLTTIPRASTITATSVYIGETSQLTVSRKSNNFTHTIYYSFGSLNGYILADGTTTQTATKLSETSIGFPTLSSWFDEIPNASQGTCNLRITTYNGNTQIGSVQTSSFAARVDKATSSPIVTSSVVDTNNTTLDLTGDSSVLVKGHSIAEVTWNATAQNSATITNVTINGTTVTSSPYSFTLNDNNINVIATDSRGYSTTSNPVFTIKDYNPPLFTMSLERVAPTSSYAKVIFNGSWFNDNFGSVTNNLTIYWKYKKTSDSEWITGGTLVNGTDYTISSNSFYSGTSSSPSQIQIGGSLDYDYAWDIILYVEDELETYSVSQTMTQGIPIINWGSDYFNVNGDIKQFSSPIIESDSNANGTYVKYADGTMICYKILTVSVKCSSPWGSLYESGSISFGATASTFAQTPTVFAYASARSAFIEGLRNISTTSYGSTWLARPMADGNNETYIINLMAIGKWK